MAVEVRLPSLGVAVMEATVLRWFRSEGDRVEAGEPLAEVETDKVTFEVMSPAAGTLLKVLYPENSMAKVDETIAFIGEAGEEVSIEKPEARPAEAPSPAAEAKPAERKASPRAYPVAKRLAKELGVDLGLITGTGPRGVITKEDVQQYYDGSSAVSPEEGDVEVLPFVGIRKRIADHVVRSKQTAPHVTSVIDVDMSAVVELRKEILQRERRKDPGFRLTFLPFVMRAALSGIKENPIINSSLVGDKIIIKKYINLGVATATREGLIVPVIKNAHRMSLLELAAEAERLAEKAREGRLGPEDVRGGTFSISNGGVFGTLISTPIINQPQSAVLWMGRIVETPVVRDGQIVARPMMYLTISYDHRVMDGMSSALFLRKVKEELENPGGLLQEEREGKAT